ncbi:MAG: DUF3849 domain-containing protein [Eubacterium sp.]|nr:DUF3849 domain-containing protein [Eubacterium sp.]
MTYNETNIQEIRKMKKEINNCAEAIKNAVKENSTYVNNGIHFEAKKAVEQVISEFPVHRAALIIAHQVVPDENCLIHPNYIDGRYSRTVQNWARETISGEKDFDFRRYEYCDIAGTSHPVIINAFAEKFIQKEAELAAEESAEQAEEYVQEAVEGQGEEMCL